jgi:hypothetical protein
MIRIALLTALVLLTAACNRTTYTWNQRMTVTVETPDGIVSGSSVVEVTALYCNPGCGLAGDIEVNYSYQGEAAAFEVLPDQWLFALIDNPAELMYRASPDQFGGIQRHERGRWLAATPRQTEAVELTEGLRPRLVTFADITVPASVEAVDADNLAATFGEGVRLVEVTLEVVPELPDAEYIRSLLPWLPDVYSTMLDGSSVRSLYAENRLANDLTQNNFWRP